jgi:hypothetical protein
LADFSLGTSQIFIHKKTLARRLPGHSSEILLAGKNSEQSGLQLVLGIYPLRCWIAMPQNGAALWI